MRVLVTGGSTQVPIDQVRCLSNVFKGKTGSDIADYFYKEGDNVTFITSGKSNFVKTAYSRVIPYKTYDELYSLMDEEITLGSYDVIIHSAAVSDYIVEGTYVDRGIHNGEWEGFSRVDSSTKISSDNPELYLKLIPTEKIVDKIRKDWGFLGILVKFKLQVGISNEELIKVAKESMHTSDADMIVANCLEWAKERAYIIKRDSEAIKTDRKDLPNYLHQLVKTHYEKGM